MINEGAIIDDMPNESNAQNIAQKIIDFD